VVSAIRLRERDMVELLKWVTDTLQAASMGPAALPLAFLLGLVSALASACCTLPAMGMLVAYSGTRQNVNRRSSLVSAVWFLIGTSLALVVLGSVAGLVGQTAQAFLGRYWKLFAGVVAVLFGLAALKMLPVKLPSRTQKEGASSASGGKMGAALGGLFLGGGVAACSLPCNPGIFIVMGASILMGRMLWGMLLMALFAVGFSLPLAAILFGVSLGKASLKMQKAEAAIRGVAGVLLVGAGLYLLATF
jgi:cytochrome c biogenesis protein CcdA